MDLHKLDQTPRNRPLTKRALQDSYTSTDKESNTRGFDREQQQKRKTLDGMDLDRARKEDKEISQFYKNIYADVKILMHRLFQEESVVSKYVGVYATNYAEKKQKEINFSLAKFKQNIINNLTASMTGPINNVPEELIFLRTFIDDSTHKAIDGFLDNQLMQQLEGLKPLNAQLVTAEYDKTRKAFHHCAELKKLKINHLSLFIDDVFNCLSSYLQLDSKETC